ncbi:hypothetical protein CEXT_204021, partial [Caerostris extrusa]
NSWYSPASSNTKTGFSGTRIYEAHHKSKYKDSFTGLRNDIEVPIS